MGNVLVSCNDLTEYGTFLEKESKELKVLMTKMETIVASLENGWQGIDADNFKANATAYIRNLKTVEASLAFYGDYIKGKSSRYNNACANFYEILNR